MLCLVKCHPPNYEHKPEIYTNLKETNNNNFYISLSNESREKRIIDLSITLDGETIVEDKLEYGEGKRKEFRFHLKNGYHSIDIESRKGNSRISQSFEFSDSLWLSANYFYSSGRKGDLKIIPRFTVRTEKNPIFYQ